MTVQTPEWVKHAVFYQIFPDRFARSPRTPHPKGLRFKAWGTPPEEQGFQGGDLYGVVDKLDYLQELGITAIYFNPIFSSAANHRYHTFDYMQVDPLLGGTAALRELLDEAHKRDMRVVLDGVFNHASRGFWPFHHILETGGNSPYLDWFIIHDWPLRPYSSDKDNPPNYAAWWNLPDLPKLNTNNPAVQTYILDVARYWLEFGIDGWRLDVPAEIDDDDFWRRFRQVVKSTNPEAYICGEVWEEASRWLQGDQFDSVMNYTIMWATLSFFGGKHLNPNYQREHLQLEPLDATGFAAAIDENLQRYDWEINLAQLNLLDSHDTARALWIASGDVVSLKLCVLFQMTFPGAPCIYYGDEVGMSAGDDPYCRAAFPWHDETSWNTDLLTFYKRATALRHRYPALRTGTYKVLLAEGAVYAFQRKLDDQDVIVAFNADAKALSVTLNIEDSGSTWRAVWPESDDGQTFTASNSKLSLTLSARDALVLIKA